jgi:dihydrodipicolinate synthase/N-acetylneuraminate lyase
LAIDDTRAWLRGPVVAVATPFGDDFALDLPGLARTIEFMVSGGLTRGQGVLLVGGAAGEFPALDRAERIAVMTAAVEAAAGRVPIMTSIQDTDWREVEALARAAQDAGVDGLQIGVPYYYPATADDLLRFLEVAGRAVSIPLMAYATWWEGGLTIDGALMRRLAEVPNVEAVKWSAPSVDQFTEGLVAAADRLVVIDNLGLHVWSHLLGASGFVTHVGGFWPEYALGIWHALEAGDYPGARDRLLAFKPAWSAWAGRVMAETGGEGPFIKAALEQVGLPAGPPRPPSVAPSAPRLAELRDLFAAAGVPRAGALQRG